MHLGLFRGQEIGDDGMDHRQQTVVQSGMLISRMQPVLEATIRMKIGETGQRLVDDQQPLKVRAHARRVVSQSTAVWSVPDNAGPWPGW